MEETKYTIVNGSITEIKRQVNELMKEGWKPQGGLSCGDFGTYQAMIKETKNVHKTK